MEFVSKKSKLKELILFLRSSTKGEIIAVCQYLKKHYGIYVPTYKSADEMLDCLSEEATQAELWEAIDNVIEEDPEESDDVEEFILDDDDDDEIETAQD